jgi:AcrR family transcriptional regulator
MRDVKEPEVRRAEIMDAALMLFMQKGYLNTTTQDIIEKVKMSRGLLYYHFKNKEDVLYCLIERHTEPMLRKLSSIASDTNMSAIDKLKSFFKATLIIPESITDEVVTMQKAVDLEQNRYLMDRLSHNFIDKVKIHCTKISEQGVKENVFDVEHPLEMSMILITGFVFASNEIKEMPTSVEEQKKFISTCKSLLTRALGIDASILND